MVACTTLFFINDGNALQLQSHKQQQYDQLKILLHNLSIFAHWQIKRLGRLSPAIRLQQVADLALSC